MSERDAFGRGREEDTLAGMGWREPRFVATIEDAPANSETAEMPVVTTPPTATHTPARPAPRPAPAPARPRRRGRRRGPRVMTRVLFLGIVAASILFALRSGTTWIGDIEDAIRGRAGSVTRTVPVEGGSLLGGTKAFAAALKGLPAGDIEMLRLTPGELDAQVIVDGRRHSVRVSARGRVLDVPTPGGARTTPVRVDPRAPARIIRTASRRAGRPPATVSYLVLMRLGGRPQWQLFFKDGLHYSASTSGRSVRRVAAHAPPPSPRPPPPPPTPTPPPRRAGTRRRRA